MAYCTQSDILTEISEKELAELTSEVDGHIDAAVVTQMIDNADAEIDGYVGKKYSVPLASPIPKLIKTCSIRMTVYNLYARRAARLGGINEVIEQNYKNSVKMLENISKGLLSLGVDPPPAAPSTGQPKFETGTDVANRDFTKDSMSGL
ncbi:MAG: gp436 family protein [Bacteroidota bacterium]